MRTRNMFGIILLIIGAIALLNNFTDFWWLRWHYLWPVILIAIGLVIVFGSRRK